MTLAAEDRGGLAARWVRLGRGQRVAVVVVVAALVVNLTLSAVDSMLGSDPGGPVSSSFSTGSDGLEAYADLLRRSGHPVTRVRDQLRPSDLPAGATAVLADAESLTPSEGKALLAFVAEGGRLVVAGQGSDQVVQAATGVAVRRGDGGRARRLRTWVPAPEVGSARLLAGDEGGRWRRVGPLLPVIGADGEAAVVVGDAGEGRVVAVADASVLQNRNLSQADNAAFALAAAGPAGRPVVFVESVHGFAGGGLDAVPSSWRWAAAGLLLALVLGLWAAGTRFGPPEPAARRLRPPRLDHVRAVAADLDRVTPPSPDLAAELQAGAEAAAAARRTHGLADPSPSLDPTSDRPRAGARP